MKHFVQVRGTRDRQRLMKLHPDLQFPDISQGLKPDEDVVGTEKRDERRQVHTSLVRVVPEEEYEQIIIL